MTIEANAAQAPCKHYWIIPDSTKETVTGVCKLCGQEKPDMQNQWGFHGPPREAVREWQFEEHLKKVAAQADTGGGGLTPI